MDKAFIRKIKECGVRRLAERFGTQLHQVNENTWMGHCPNPMHEDSHESFMVSLNPDGLESWCCFTCHQGAKGDGNYGSDNIAFVQWMFSNTHKGAEMNFKEAVKTIAKFYGIPMEQGKYDFVYKENERHCTEYEKSLTDFVRLYLYGRGLEDEDIKKWRLGFDGDRVTFPIFSADGSIVGFSNRAFSKVAIDSGRKYVNSKTSPVFKKNELFYGLNFASRSNSGSLFIVEGQMDAIMAHKYGIDNAVATLTCKLSAWHINYIKEHNLSPVLCYDFDEAGQDGMQRAMRALYAAGIKNIKLVVLPDKRDIADLGRDLKENLPTFIEAHTMSYSQYLLSGIANRLDSVIMEEQQKCMSEVRVALDNITDPDERMVAENFIKNRIFRAWAA